MSKHAVPPASAPAATPLAPLGSNGFPCCGGVTGHNAWCGQRPAAPTGEEAETALCLNCGQPFARHDASDPARLGYPCPGQSRGVWAYRCVEPPAQATALAALRARVEELEADKAIVDAMERGLVVDDVHGNQTVFDVYWPNVEVHAAPTVREAARAALAPHQHPETKND